MTTKPEPWPDFRPVLADSDGFVRSGDPDTDTANLIREYVSRGLASGDDFGDDLCEISLVRGTATPYMAGVTLRLPGTHRTADRIILTEALDVEEDVEYALTLWHLAVGGAAYLNGLLTTEPGRG